MTSKVWIAWLAITVAGVGPIISDAHAQQAKPVKIAVLENGTTETPRTKGREARVTLDLRGVTVEAAIHAIAEQAGLTATYASDMVPVALVSIRATDMPVQDALATALRGTGLMATITPSGVLGLVKTASRIVAQGVVTGKVTDAKTGRPVVGATILIDDATKGVVTGDDGVFRVTVPTGEHRITVRAVGYVKQGRQITISESQTVTLTLVLDASTSVLDEVVVTGTVVATERKAIPTPITVITAADIEKRGITRVEQLFRGEIPGVVALETGSMRYNDSLGAMGTSQLFSRGASNLPFTDFPIAPNALKVYVDGVELLNANYLGTIDPKSIERIEVITGPQAATIYGSGAIGGVMQVFTKKGVGSTHPDVTINSRYGMMETNLSAGRTPAHSHALLLTGGTGPTFSYSGNATYNYSGQWQPNLYDRTFGGSIGAVHTTGPLTASGSVSATSGENGIASGGYYYTLNAVAERDKKLNGEWAWNGPITQKRKKGTSSSQIFSLNVDYRATAYWQHHLTVGKSITNFGLVPSAPTFEYPYDSLFEMSKSNGSRNTLGYNMSFITPRVVGLTSTLTLGGNGSSADQAQFNGCTAKRDASSVVGCYPGSPPYITRSVNNSSIGGFASWQIGVLDHVYLTFGLRGEHNPAYGQNHKLDWTPTNGMTMVFERGNATLKLLGSYGRSTRPPRPDMRLEVIDNLGPDYSQPTYVSQMASPDITPEYSRGPQGGLELYYGNLGSITVNHYRQTITDLIQFVPVDSVLIANTTYGWESYWQSYQYLNVATINQKGWEGTASVNLGPLTLKGTYSWNDSRIGKLNSRGSGILAQYGGYSGAQLPGVPTHNGNITASYAYGGLSVTLVNNYTGASNQQVNSQFRDYGYARLRMYQPRLRSAGDGEQKPGYLKSDLIASQRLSSWASATLNVTNLGNSYGNEQFLFVPSIGRQTQVGVSLRFPRTR